MASILVVTPDPAEATALPHGFVQKDIQHEDVRMGALNCVLLPSLDMLLAVGGNGKAQYGIQAQYLIHRCDGPELLVCAGGAGRLTEEIQIGDIVLGTATVEHDYKERSVRSHFLATPCRNTSSANSAVWRGRQHSRSGRTSA